MNTSAQPETHRERTERLSPLELLTSLYPRPSRWFADIEPLKEKPAFLIVAWIAGTTSAIDRIDANLIRSDLLGRSVPTTLVDSWLAWSGLLVIFIVWSCIASYKAVRAAFAVSRWKARLWFLFCRWGSTSSSGFHRGDVRDEGDVGGVASAGCWEQSRFSCRASTCVATRAFRNNGVKGSGWAVNLARTRALGKAKEPRVSLLYEEEGTT